MEQQPMVWNQIYSTTYKEGLVHVKRVYYDNGYIREYILKGGTLLDTRKMTKEDHEYVNEQLDNLSAIFGSIIKDIRKKTEEVKQDKFKD